MSVATETNPNFTALRDDLNALKQDVASLVTHVRLEASNGADHAVSRLDENVHRLVRNLAAEGEVASNAIGRQVIEQPIMALLVALGVGYVGGRLLPR